MQRGARTLLATSMAALITTTVLMPASPAGANAQTTKPVSATIQSPSWHQNSYWWNLDDCRWQGARNVIVGDWLDYSCDVVSYNAWLLWGYY